MEELQLVIDSIINMFSLAFPFALVFWIVERVTFYFLSIISGREVRL